jgi:hypothetical protein
MVRSRKRKPFEYHLGESDRAALAERPNLMKRTPGPRSWNITADDIVWLAPGKDGELDIHLPEQGYEQYSPLDLVLLGIIRANQKAGKQRDSERSDRQRLKQARTALLGKSQRDPGLTNADDRILLKVARRVLESIFAGEGDSIELAPLIREYASAHYTEEKLKRSDDGENSIIRRLADYFEKCRDEYLTRVTCRNDYDRASNLTLIHEIFDRLEQLCVKVVREGMPRMSGEDEICIRHAKARSPRAARDVRLCARMPARNLPSPPSPCFSGVSWRARSKIVP